jgi:LysR family glycine cleavage system transcriptional activator
MLGGPGEDNIWLAEHGFDTGQTRTTHFDTGGMALQAVRAGNGVSVMPHGIVERDIELGALVVLYKEDPGDLAYYIVRRPDHVSDRARVFVRWLKRQV